jgi:hypothetical protein
MPHTEQGLVILNLKFDPFFRFQPPFYVVFTVYFSADISRICCAESSFFSARMSLGRWIRMPYRIEISKFKWRNIPVRTSISPNLNFFDSLPAVIIDYKLFTFLYEITVLINYEKPSSNALQRQL